MEQVHEVQSLNSTEVEESESGLDEAILRIIASIPDKTIRPGRIAAELGISVEDASAELSGLLAAVGGGIVNGATFRFERVGDTNTMVFQFPDDFQERALRKRRKEDLRAAMRNCGVILVKVLKIVTAFGLIISLLIVSVAALVGIVAAIIALSRGGDHRQRSFLNHQLRSVFFSVRQLLWFYALFGPENEDTGDPFMREIAYDLWLFFSLCCGNPSSIFFWMRANHFRRHRRRRWSSMFERNSTASGIPGVTLIHRDEGDPIEPPVVSHQGLLSIAVEFLFGPTPFHPRPSEAQKWVLRANALMRLSSVEGGVSLKAMSPYVDNPPSSNDEAKIVEQTMLIVAHFHGMPWTGDEAQRSIDKTFIFPELMAESSHFAGRCFQWTEEDDNGTWQELVCLTETAQSRTSSSIPKYLKEDRYKLTLLSPKQFSQCCFLGILNLIGVLWFDQAIKTGGTLELGTSSALGIFLHKALIPVLKFYAVLFFALALGRLLLIIVWNSQRHEDNRRRALLAATFS